MSDDLTKLAAKARPLAEALLRPVDARHARIIDHATRGGHRIQLDRTAGQLPTERHDVIQAQSIEVAPSKLSSSTNLADMLLELVGAITNLLVMQESDGSPSGVPTRLIFPTGTLDWDEDRREMAFAPPSAPINYYTTWGPWILNDVPASATTTGKLMTMDTATTIKQSASGIRAGRTGEIIGVSVSADTGRTAGTLIVRPEVGGTSYVFDGDSVTLTSSPSTRMTSFVDPGAGVAIASGSDELSVNFVTSGWAPTTANVCAWLIVRYDAM
jgi:hypothetical protein